MLGLIRVLKASCENRKDMAISSCFEIIVVPGVCPVDTELAGKVLKRCFLQRGVQMRKLRKAKRRRRRLPCMNTWLVYQHQCLFFHCPFFAPFWWSLLLFLLSHGQVSSFSSWDHLGRFLCKRSALKTFLTEVPLSSAGVKKIGMQPHLEISS